MRKLLQRLGCSFHQVSGFLFKADPDKQQEFLQQYAQDQQTAQAEGWRRYFLDGVHPLYGLEVVFYRASDKRDENSEFGSRLRVKGIVNSDIVNNPNKLKNYQKMWLPEA